MTAVVVVFHHNVPQLIVAHSGKFSIPLFSLPFCLTQQRQWQRQWRFLFFTLSIHIPGDPFPLTRNLLLYHSPHDHHPAPVPSAI
jgi:hypothetical protein